MKKILFKFIDFYKAMFSPFIHTLYPLNGCKFYPTCSEYSHDVIEKHGVIKGVGKSVWRILRCNPLSQGGIDQA
ncbi:MAG: membrane protein insertion efficiency factor YidD [Candidatus Yanofskybacteria bacterium CG10_big_fil_rev_8_21_14_0_10_36_16]|uniref:Putative membrane protein insertion efficiency factor n=1 Tax=Candidatus Yanofskybacteria bacterium CG10_big_fil_rev_8_21_14_0_10_36_16 TaxID=1975096 RepID=A0A2J0Q6G7_9BACT|nr:MAG: membrane protein insertion efficiency factor YidD [Candidatus Yanofskybacteria bacterium CG10_big_fil_rev_8_21_14_0_10_36_16]